ncbi:MAG TPA: hypothetical protein VGX78_16395 [Pirellulales bacterium]|jgi:hypothetical protein|nr:hypothetical protein [Pirellulales bacterium]
MTLAEQTRAALAAVPAFADGLRTVSAEHGGLRLTCDLTALDTLACEFTRFAVRADKLAASPIGELKRVSEKLAARLTYLLEPISPVEVDAQQCVVQLRSNPPQRDADRTSYYELLVRRGGELSLCRWTKNPGDVRQALSAQVTREVLLRLVSDFAAVAG